MQKRKIIVLFILFAFNSFFCFTQENNLILTEKENTLWFENLNEIEKTLEKIDFISERLRNDRRIYIKWSFPDGIKVKNIPKLDSLRKIRVEGFCKPLFIVKYKTKQISFRFENPLDAHKTNSVIGLLNIDNIKHIDIWTDDKKLIYGSSADCGVIFFEANKRKVYKALKKLKLTSIYMDEIMSY
jgi:hypothetical protein